MYDVLIDKETAARMLKVDKNIISALIMSRVLEHSINGGFEELVYISSVFKNQGKSFKNLPKVKRNDLNVWRNKIKTEAIKSGYRKYPFKALSGGYWVLLDKYKRPKIKEHRYVVQSHYRKKLKPDQVVHHINGDRTDNRIKNLKILAFSKHARLPRRKTRENQRNYEQLSKIPS